MKRLMFGGATALGLMSATFGATADEPQGVDDRTESPFSVELSLDVLSDYVWRGTICNDNPVWQPSVTAAYNLKEYGKISGNIWSSLDLTHKRGSATNSRRACGMQEIDYTLSYEVTLYDIGVELGHIWYTFPNANGSTDQDLYTKLSYETPYVTPSAAFFWNYSDSAGTDASAVYAMVGLEHEFTLTAIDEALTLTPSVSLGFGNNAYTDAGYELTDQTVGLATAYEVIPNLKVGAQINYTWTPSHTLRQNGYMGEGKDQLVWGGVKLTFSF